MILWMRHHRGMNGLSLALAVAELSMAVVVLSKLKREHASGIEIVTTTTLATWTAFSRKLTCELLILFKLCHGCRSRKSCR
jgi:hypothetical protein